MMITEGLLRSMGGHFPFCRETSPVGGPVPARSQGQVTGPGSFEHRRLEAVLGKGATDRVRGRGLKSQALQEPEAGGPQGLSALKSSF